MVGTLNAIYEFVSHIDITYPVRNYVQQLQIYFTPNIKSKFSSKHGRGCFINKTWQLQQYCGPYHLQYYRMWFVHGETPALDTGNV